MGSIVATTRRLSLKQGSGRIANAVADLLRKKLTVPNIYLKPRIPGDHGVDVMAVDQAGGGDVHGVEIAYLSAVPKSGDLVALIARLKALPLHFKYLAVADVIGQSGILADMFRGSRSFSSDGIGRLGLIEYSGKLHDQDFDPLGATPAALIIRPERFLLRGTQLAQVESFISKVRPDMQVRI